MFGATSEMDPPGPDLNEKQSMQGFEQGGFYCEEICSKNLLALVAQQVAPTMAIFRSLGRWHYMLALEDISNRRASNSIAQFEQFTVQLAWLCP